MVGTLVEGLELTHLRFSYSFPSVTRVGGSIGIPPGVCPKTALPPGVCRLGVALTATPLYTTPLVSAIDFFYQHPGAHRENQLKNFTLALVVLLNCYIIEASAGDC